MIEQVKSANVHIHNSILGKPRTRIHLLGLLALVLTLGNSMFLASAAQAQAAAPMITNYTLCLDLHWGDYATRRNGGRVQTWGCNNQPNQKWRYTPATGEIKLYGTNLCLDVHGTHWNNRTLGGIVWTHACHGGINQKWTVSSPVGPIKSSNGQCLDVHWGDWVYRNNGGKVQMWSCNNQGNQRWSFATNTGGPISHIKYDDMGRRACHNCYEKKYAATIGEALDRVKSIEIDFYDQTNVYWPPRFQSQMPNDWYVRHYPTGGNDNNCGGNLSHCLGSVKKWSDQNPGHDVITVYLDKKQGWGWPWDRRSPTDLDTLIDSIFADRIYTPSDLKGSYGSLRAAAIFSNWRTLSQLKGKVMFVLTGGGLGRHNQTQHDYLQEVGMNAKMFVAVDLDEQRDITGTPEGFTDATAGNLVFFNLKQDNFNQSWINSIRARNYVTRMWWSGGEDTGRSLCSFLNQNVAQPAFYKNWKIFGDTVVDLNSRNNVCRRL